MSSAELMPLCIPISEVDSLNEDTINTPASSLNGEERVLIEKDGKFELIKAQEIEASPLPIESTPVDLTENKHILTQPNHLKTSKPKHTKDSNVITKSKREVKRTDSTRRIPATSVVTEPSNIIQGLSAFNSTPSLPQSKPRSRPNTQPHTSMTSPSIIQVRPQTAPLDYNPSSSLYSIRDSERRKLAQEAFLAWLDMKDKQLIEVSRSKREFGRDSTLDMDKKKANAYLAWMKNKRKQILSEIEAKDKMETKITKDIKPESKTPFDKWLKKKKNTSTLTLTSFQRQKQK
ncbi:hypothetical protein LOD99_971 [Oopsacas minuta]|uniref:Coiled-coil domain-containing protein 181 n=1 Tax=Oopsacas minuta TaxID=111878 RepID=A0AAV7K1D5_9METZ|nr:hypothetical protein LOD99_971 [Oopsacas minuta]